MTPAQCIHRIMNVKALTVRGVDPKLARALAREVRRRGASLNQTVLDLLRSGLGVAPGAVASSGLARHAGTWSAEDQREFDAAVAGFGEVDPEMWR